MIKVEIAYEHSEHVCDLVLIERAVRIVFNGESIACAEVNIAIVDDAAIHVLNRKYLQHDYATDVLSFLLSSPGETLEGEIVVSAETAAREAVQYGWNQLDELLLYVIHGVLHLVGYDDATDAERTEMRVKERHYLAKLDRHPSYDDSVPFRKGEIRP